MLGGTDEYAPLPYFFSDQYDLGMEYSGWVAPGEYDRVVFRGDPTSDPNAPEFLAFWLRDGAVLAGMNANIWDVNDDRQFTWPFWKAATEIDPKIGAWDPRTQFSLRGREKLLRLWADAGLQDVTVATILIPTVFRDFDDYWQPCLLDGSTPIQRYVRSLGPDQRLALRECLRTVLPIAADGSITLHGSLLIARGTK